MKIGNPSSQIFIFIKQKPINLFKLPQGFCLVTRGGVFRLRDKRKLVKEALRISVKSLQPQWQRRWPGEELEGNPAN